MKNSQIISIGLIIVCSFLEKTCANNKTDNFQIIVPEKATNKTIEKLVKEQTELIKKIVSNQKQNPTSERPIITINKKIDSDFKEEKERQSIEELKKKCQELSKLSMETNVENINKEINKQIATVAAFGPIQKPEFLQKTTQPPIEHTTKKYFIITRNVTNHSNTSEIHEKTEASSLLEVKTIAATPKPQEESTHSHQPNIKYMHLEPVILQKVILNNGRTVFYWHKSIPAIPPVTSVPQYSLTHQTNHQNRPVYEQKVHKETLPTYEINYGTTKKPDDKLYKSQLRFIVPMPYPLAKENSEIPTQAPWQFDSYAYYPKPLQPDIVNMPVPYLPTFHMIKTLRIPGHGNIPY